MLENYSIVYEQSKLATEQEKSVQNTDALNRQIDLVQQEVQHLRSSMMESEIVSSFKSIIYECIDSLIEEANFETYASDLKTADLTQLKYDDGLVMSSINLKQKRIDVIRGFLADFGFLADDDQSSELAVILNDVELRLNCAQIIRNY